MIYNYIESFIVIIRSLSDNLTLEFALLIVHMDLSSTLSASTVRTMSFIAFFVIFLKRP